MLFLFFDTVIHFLIIEPVLRRFIHVSCRICLRRHIGPVGPESSSSRVHMLVLEKSSSSNTFFAA